MKIDKKEIIAFIIILFVLSLAVSSCSSRRKSIKSETKSQIERNKSEYAKDSSVIDYLIDTTKIDATEVYFEEINYYPYDTLNNGKQAVKSVKRAVIQKQKKTAGKTMKTSESVSVRKDTASMKSATETESLSNNEKQKVFPYWWMLVLIIIGAISYYMYKNLK